MHLCVEVPAIFAATIAVVIVVVATVHFDWRVHHNVHDVLDCFGERYMSSGFRKCRAQFHRQ